jgi:hypothetical protein
VTSTGWVKMEKSLETDLRTRALARALRDVYVTPERHASDDQAYTQEFFITLVLGALCRLWFRADAHISDDDTLSPLTLEDINEIVGVDQFAELIPDDWLQVVDAKTIKLPDFQLHNGIHAKGRALATKRTARWRESVTLDSLNGDARCDGAASRGRHQTKTKTKTKKDTPTPRERVAEVEKIFNHWAQVHGHKQACLDDKRYGVIAARLKDGYTEQQLIDAISGYLNSPHHMGTNDKNTKYNDISLLLRDASHVDAGIKFHVEPPRPQATNGAAVNDEARALYAKIVASGGADNTDRGRAALTKIGGYTRIRMRTDREGPFIEREFIAAYRENAP